MKSYELLFIVSVDKSEEQREQIIAKVKSMIEKEGGAIQTVDKWGVKKLAYPINFKSEGFYCLINFDSEVKVPNIIQAQLLITDGIVRSMIRVK